MIYDCFLYYDEDMLLTVRLNTMADYVDKFVIVESTHTFTGKPKKLHFDADKFSAFSDKIIYVVFDRLPHDNAWQNEADTRNAIMQGLSAAQENDIILISDVDEIFSPEALKQIDGRALCTTVYQNFYNYQFNLQVFNIDGSPRQCKLPKAVRFKHLIGFFNGEPETLRNVKRSAIKKNWFKWRWLKLRTHTISNGGWHFSWIMKPQRIAEKMSSISHTEYDLPEFNNPEHIANVINRAEDIWGRDRKLIVQPLIKPAFPDWLVDNREAYREFIRQ